MFTGRFGKEMGKAERKDVLCKLRSALEANHELSLRKKDVLTLVLDYADECLTGVFTLQLDPMRFSDVTGIFANAGLDDALFMQYVVNRLSFIRDDASRLKNRVLPAAEVYRDALLSPTVANIRKICLAGAFLALYSRNPMICLAAIIGALSAPQLALLRLEQALKDKQNARLLQGDAPKLGDGLDTYLSEGGQAAGRTLHAAATGAISMANQSARLFARSLEQTQPARAIEPEQSSAFVTVKSITRVTR